MKNEYLLSGRPFLLQTDHKNLIHMNIAPSPKVNRWKLYVQGFDFRVEHIAGIRNVVADDMSRLCEGPPEPGVPEETAERVTGGMLATLTSEQDFPVFGDAQEEGLEAEGCHKCCAACPP